MVALKIIMLIMAAIPFRVVLYAQFQKYRNANVGVLFPVSKDDQQAKGNSDNFSFINKGGNTGIQLAELTNIAANSDYPIAPVNYIHSGKWSVSTYKTLITLNTFRSGGSKLHSIQSTGYNNKNRNCLYSWEAGFGSHLRVASCFRINTELVTIELTDFKSGDYFRGSFRVSPEWRFTHRFVLFVGPNFNYFRIEKGKDAPLVNNHLQSKKETGGQVHSLYFGAKGGLIILL